MKITPLQYAILLHEITSKGENIQKKIKEFSGILYKNNDFNLLPRIIEEFEKYDKKQKGIVDVEIISAKPISREMKKQIVDSIKVKGKLDVKELINPDLLGGVMVTIGDMMIDGSLREKLRKLDKALA